MTNGEKMQAVFPYIEMWGESKDTLDYSLGGMVHRITKSWWNAEYKEPNKSEIPTGSTTKNGISNKSIIYKAKESKEIQEDLDKLSKLNESTTKNDLGGDCVDKAELLKAMDILDKFGNDPNEGQILLSTPALQDRYVPYVKYDDMVTCVKGMPSVTPQEPRWIPVSERLPVTNDEVLVTYIVNGNTKKRYVETANCFDGEWSSINDEYRLPNTRIEILAWQELPEPYKAESEVRNDKSRSRIDIKIIYGQSVIQ